MAWRSAFDLGVCDVFVRFRIYGDGTIYGDEKLVHIDDLDPAVGVCNIVDGEVVCEFTNDIGGSSGEMPSVVAVPRYDPVADHGATEWRAVEVSAEGGGGLPNGDSYVAFNAPIYLSGEQGPTPEYEIDTAAPGAFYEPMHPLSLSDGEWFGVTGTLPLTPGVEPTDLPGIGIEFFNPGA